MIGSIGQPAAPWGVLPFVAAAPIIAAGIGLAGTVGGGILGLFQQGKARQAEEEAALAAAQQQTLAFQQSMQLAAAQQAVAAQQAQTAAYEAAASTDRNRMILLLAVGVLGVVALGAVTVAAKRRKGKKR